MKKPASLVAAIVFWLIALAQLLRVSLGVRVTAGHVVIPLWPSVLAFIILGIGVLALARATGVESQRANPARRTRPTAPEVVRSPILA